MATRSRSVPKLEREVAELRARVAELERNRDLLNAIANTAPSLLCLVDGEGRVRDRATNIAFERALGYDPSETGGVLFWERYVPPQDAAAVQAAVEGVIAGADPLERDGRWLTRSGAILRVAWTCSALPEIADGRLFLICGTDITDRERHADEVRRSRARIVAAADAERKRLERNLHDGAQQHLVASLLALRLLRGQAHAPETATGLEHAVVELEEAVEELRELARGIHPAGLTERGLAAALEQLARRSPVPVTVEAPSQRYHERVEAAAYYVVSEALANVAKYAGASSASVRVVEEGGSVHVEVADDGIGGADASRGSGLRGLADRVAALDGTLAVVSRAGAGTTIRADLPLA